MSDLFDKTDIEGCFTFKSSVFKDQRGSFVKMYSKDVFKSKGLNISIAEVFFSSSHKNVIRGMHFQAPPYAQAKIVTCISGRILDVILDIRKGSATYGKAIGIDLTSVNEKTVFIPKGCAHGFYSYEDNSAICYAVETCHSKEADQGILWDSFGFKWPSGSEKAILSERDLQLPAFKKFESPF